MANYPNILGVINFPFLEYLLVKLPPPSKKSWIFLGLLAGIPWRWIKKSFSCGNKLPAGCCVPGSRKGLFDCGTEKIKFLNFFWLNLFKVMTSSRRFGGKTTNKLKFDKQVIRTAQPYFHLFKVSNSPVLFLWKPC